MARQKGGKNEVWTQEGISRNMIYQWITKYRDGGAEALIPLILYINVAST